MEHEEGFTLIEMALSLAILGVVLALFIPTLTAFLNVQTKVQGQISADTGAQPALLLLSRQVNSAKVLYDPVGTSDSYANTGVAPGFALLMETDSTSGYTCVQWRVKSGQLQERSWSATATTPATLQFTDVLVGDSLANSPSEKPFTAGATTATRTEKQVLTVTWWITSGTSGVAVEVTALLVAQGVYVGSTACSAPPASRT